MTPHPTVNFGSPTYSVEEGDGSASITVTLDTVSVLTVTVDYATSDGTATAGDDYVAISGALTFTPGATVQTFTVPILDDTLSEVTEMINLTLSNPVNALIGGTSPSMLAIVDDDDQFDVYLPVALKNPD